MRGRWFSAAVWKYAYGRSKNISCLEKLVNTSDRKRPVIPYKILNDPYPENIRKMFPGPGPIAGIAALGSPQWDRE